MRITMTNNRIIPTTYEVSDKGVKAMDVYSRLLRERIIFVNGEVNHLMSDDIIAQLLLLESEDKNADIYMYINSPGGCVVSGTSIVDTMNLIKPDVVTVVTGYACSMGSVIASSGTLGKRFILPNAQFMLHQVSAGTRGNVQDMEASFEHTKKLNKKLMQILADNTGHTLGKILKDTTRDLWLDAEASVNYGLVDSIMKKR
jgi:ATP-dependent Clp protease protease subunit